MSYNAIKKYFYFLNVGFASREKDKNIAQIMLSMK